MTSELLYESLDGVVTITIARPEKKNAISDEVARALGDAWERFETGHDKVAVITGAGGGNFSSGADVGNPPQGYSFLPGIGQPLTKPVIAAVPGWCIGAGFVLVNRCDFCVAEEDARFLYPEPRLGIGRGLLAGLVNRIPYKIAMETMLLAEVMPAQRMWEAGFVNRLVPSGESLKVAQQMAATLASYDSDTVRFIKESALRALEEGPGEKAEAMRARGDRLAGNRAWGKTD